MVSILDENLRKGIALIRSKVVDMGNLAEQAIAASLVALVNVNRRLANAIILKDDRIDELEKELDRLCLEFLVRQQPVAGHLRFLYSCIKINTELERIGDYAESIARHVLLLETEAHHPALQLFVEIGDLASKMLHDAIQAFVNQDADLARATINLERLADDIRTQIRLDILNMNAQGKLSLDNLVPLLIIGSRYERVADQAVNICEEVLYICTGEFEKHKGTEVFRVLFLYDNNRISGQMALGIALAMNRDRFLFTVTSVEPHELDPGTVSFMAGKGIDISDHRPATLHQIPNLDHYQVIVVLGEDAQEAAHALPGKSIQLNWFPPDPSQMIGSVSEIHAAYERTYHYLDENIRDFVHAVESEDIYP